MTGFVIGNVRQVREITAANQVNLHLSKGWVLLLVRTGQETDYNYETGKPETLPTTVYVIGWANEGEPENDEKGLLSQQNESGEHVSDYDPFG